MNKKAILGSIFLMAGLIQPVLAQEINSKEDFEIWCSPQAYYYNAQHPDCEELRQIWAPETRENPVVRPREEPQTRENQRPIELHRFVKKASTQKNYGTLTVGAFFPSIDSEIVNQFGALEYFNQVADLLELEVADIVNVDVIDLVNIDDLETGIGFSVNYGRLLGRNFALEAEFVSITGGIGEASFNETSLDNLKKEFSLDPTLLDDVQPQVTGTYTFFGLIVGPVFRFSDPKSLRTAFFISPGVGFGTVQLANNSDFFIGDTNFVFQVKAGFEVEISKSLTLLLQGRYLNTSFGPTNIEFWSPEVGIRFWF